MLHETSVYYRRPKPGFRATVTLATREVSLGPSPPAIALKHLTYLLCDKDYL